MRSTIAMVCLSEEKRMIFQKHICGTSADKTFVYVIGNEREKDEICGLCADCSCTLVFVPCTDWNRELSPWCAPGLLPDGEEFSGEAGVYLQRLLSSVLPVAEKGTEVYRRYIAGYSLAGLFSIWSLYQTDQFRGAASLSGSLWYDGFLTYTGTHTFLRQPERIVLSVGGKEKNSKNSRVQRVEDCTRQLYMYYRTLGIDTQFTLHPGGHFANVPYRIANGIRMLIGDV